MIPKIRVDFEALLRTGQAMVLELGCGRAKTRGRIGIDSIELPEVDIVADLNEGLPFVADQTIDEIHAHHVLEHVENFVGLLGEIVRVLKPHGKAYVTVPHFSNPYFYSDYTHRRFFGLYTFYYFVDEAHQLSRKVPDFYTKIRIGILSQRLVFKSPFNTHSLYRRVLGKVFNLSSRTQDFYEGNLCYLFPCYEVRVVFTRGA